MKRYTLTFLAVLILLAATVAGWTWTKTERLAAGSTIIAQTII